MAELTLLHQRIHPEHVQEELGSAVHLHHHLHAVLRNEPQDGTQHQLDI